MIRSRFATPRPNYAYGRGIVHRESVPSQSVRGIKMRSSSGINVLAGRSISLPDVMRRRLNPVVEVTAPIVVNPIKRARVVVPRKTLIARLTGIGKNDALRLSVNGSVEMTTLVDVPRYADGNGWHKADTRIETRDNWESTHTAECVSAVIDSPQQLVKLLGKAKADVVTVDLVTGSPDSGPSIVLRAGAAEFELSATDATDFPAAEPLATNSVVLVDAQALRRLLDSVAFACESESTGYALGGVLVELSADGIDCAATDSRRLAQIHDAAESADGFLPSKQVIPRAAVDIVVRKLRDTVGPVAVALTENEFAVESELWTVRGKVVQGRFPDWRSIVPSSFGHYVKLSRTDLVEALETALLVTNEENRGVDFSFGVDDSTVRIAASGNGKCKLTLVAEHAIDGDCCGTMALDPRFVLDYAKRSDAPDIVFALNSATAAVVIECDGAATYLLMPLSRTA